MKLSLFFLFALFLSLSTFATPTKLIVRAKAKDAKFIGSSMGGARIIVREALSEQILAEGFTTGSTGSTEKIMKEPHQRHQPLADEETAAFITTLELEKPTLVTIEGYGPWAYPNARIKAQTQVWLIPGKHITGDGIVLEFPGLIVEMVAPQTLESLSPSEEGSITANVVMMCGCPITAGGLWDADQYEVQALLKKDGKEISTIPLKIGEKANTFSARFSPKSSGLTQPGNYELTVYAHHALTGNTGVATTYFIVK